MMGFVLRLAGCLTLLFAVPVLLIRAQPYDASLLRSALLPADCAPPCFMGLRPGHTMLSEAVRFFEQRPNVHFAVQRSEVSDASEDTAVLYWREDGSPISGSMNFDNGQLVELTIQGLELYEIWLALGEPDSGQMAMELTSYTDGANIFSRVTAHINYYQNRQIRVHTPSTCLAFWQQLSYVVIGQSAAPDSVGSRLTMAQQRQTACEQERAYLRIIGEG